MKGFVGNAAKYVYGTVLYLKLRVLVSVYGTMRPNMYMVQYGTVYGTVLVRSRGRWGWIR